MATQQQEQRPDQLDTRSKQRRRLSRRVLVILTVLFLAVAIITWILSYLNVIPSFWASIFTIIITVLGAVFAFFQSMHLFLPAEKYESSETSPHASAKTSIPIVSPYRVSIFGEALVSWYRRFSSIN